MPWTVELRDDPVMLEITYMGLVTRAELMHSVDEAMRRVRDGGIHALLTDCRDMQAGGHSVADLYFAAERASASGLAARVREAVLMPQRAGVKEKVEFWETTASNHGLMVRIFEDRDAALAWLRQAATDTAT